MVHAGLDDGPGEDRVGDPGWVAISVVPTVVPKFDEADNRGHHTTTQLASERYFPVSYEEDIQTSYQEGNENTGLYAPRRMELPNHRYR